MSSAFRPPPGAQTIETHVKIAAPRPLVWSILTDFKRYGEWNTYIPGIAGEPLAGSTIDLFAMEGLSGEAVQKSIKVEGLSPYRMHWVGGAVDLSQFRGDHFFEVEAGDEGISIFLHREFFTGALADAILDQSRLPITANFHLFNSDLKRFAEACNLGQNR